MGDFIQCISHVIVTKETSDDHPRISHISHVVVLVVFCKLCSPNEDVGRSNKPFGEYFRSTLWPPNEDFGRRNKRWNADFRLTFQRFVAKIEYSHPWKGSLKLAFHLLELFPKSSFGRHTLGKRDVAQIVFSRPWKVLPASGDTTDRLFRLPKSSFGLGSMNLLVKYWSTNGSHMHVLTECVKGCVNESC